MKTKLSKLRKKMIEINKEEFRKYYIGDDFNTFWNDILEWRDGDTVIFYDNSQIIKFYEYYQFVINDTFIDLEEDF